MFRCPTYNSVWTYAYGFLTISGGGGGGELINLLSSLMMEVPAIKKPVYWFALLMKELNSLEKKFGDKT